MASACGWFMSSAAASISSVVVRPLPHSRAISRNGALVMPAMGARRVSARISTAPILMNESIPLHPFPVAGLLEGVGRTVDRGLVEVLGRQHHADGQTVHHAAGNRHRRVV